MIPLVITGQTNWFKTSPEDYGWKYIGNPGFSTNPSDAVDLAYSPSGEPYVSMNESGNLSVMKYYGNNWHYVGDSIFQVSCYFTKLAFDSQGTPYVAYERWPDGMISVRKFNGTNWVYVGNSNFVVTYWPLSSLVIGPNNQPYIGFVNWNAGEAASVMTLQNNQWVYYGNKYISGTNTDYVDISFSPSGILYICYINCGFNQYSVSVKKFTGSNWILVGDSAFSPPSAWADNCKLAFSASGEPTIAYLDYNQSLCSIMKFDGNAWGYVGNQYITSDLCNNISLAYSATGDPYVAFENYSVGAKASVMKYNGINWIYVGDHVFSSDTANETTLKFNNSNNPVVAYSGHFGGYPYGSYYKVCVQTFDSVYLNFSNKVVASPKIFPNPTNNNFKIDFGNDGNYLVEVIDNLGNKRIFKNVTGNYSEINVKELEQGIYYVKIYFADKISIDKIIKY